MPDKNEKERRKKIMNELHQKAQEDFLASLPMSYELFKNLFDYLDAQLADESCDDTFKLTDQFLIDNSVKNVSLVKEWLAEKGSYCDCEVLANVEEQFE